MKSKPGKLCKTFRAGDLHGIGGFTLIELLVALAAMALLALISWRGLDAIAQAQTQHRGRDDAVLVLQTALAQWSADLDATSTFGSTIPLDWSGRALRLTRRSFDAQGLPSVRVVAWALRPGTQAPTPSPSLYWARWQSPPVHTYGEWQTAWQFAAGWAQNNEASAAGSATAPGTTIDLLPMTSWSLAHFHQGAWVPATPDAGTRHELPNGVRLVLELPAGDGLAGRLTRDWVRPTWSTERSG